MVMGLPHCSAWLLLSLSQRGQSVCRGRLRRDRPWGSLDRRQIPEGRAGPQKADHLTWRAPQVPQLQAGWVGGALKQVPEGVILRRAVRAEWGVS